LEISQAKNIIRRAHPYRDLEDSPLDKVIEFMRKMGYIKKDDSALYRTSRTRFYYFENLSMIPDERRYLVVDLTSQQNVGILGEEFMITKARIDSTSSSRGESGRSSRSPTMERSTFFPLSTRQLPSLDGTGRYFPCPAHL